MFKISTLLSKVLTASTAFVASGFLVIAIMNNNGGTQDSQKTWQEAKTNAISIEHETLIAIANNNHQLGIDHMQTGSLKNISDQQDAEEITTKIETQAKIKLPIVEEELSVLALIRNNSDVVPSVSSGTDRVSIIVKPGDTLYGISHRHGLGIDELASLNGLEEPYTIKVGQTLYVAR